jgi:hypothetical protein
MKCFIPGGIRIQDITCDMELAFLGIQPGSLIWLYTKTLRVLFASEQRWTVPERLNDNNSISQET